MFGAVFAIKRSPSAHFLCASAAPKVPLQRLLQGRSIYYMDMDLEYRPGRCGNHDTVSIFEQRYLNTRPKPRRLFVWFP